MFARLPDKPDHDALERGILDLWEREETFRRLRELNADGPRFSFVDGPVTANKALAVHTAWGRTLKDVFQRYKALRGHHQRYQNGFDCQGLWIEVGVERELGLNSKREIEEFGLAEFARRCRAKVVWSARELTEGSIRLGQWMDWGADYFTFSDTNIEYIWRFLRLMHERGRVYMGHRSTEWCPRCGTSLSQHELSQSGVYQDRSDPSLTVRFPLLDRPGQSLVIWTTTPWTLPANVAAAVHPEALYGRRKNGEWVMAARYPDETFDETVPGSALVGLRYEGPFDTLPPGAGVEHRVIPWDEVSVDEGTGIVHIAPGCGGEDFELSRVHDLPILTPVDESGRFYDEYGWLHGTSTGDAADQIVGDLAERGLLVHAGLYEHRYPHCWRCDTPLIFRISDDWFLAVEELRGPLLDANATVEWTPAYMGKRMDDWLRNMGDWNISRRRYYGLPLPFYPCGCGQLNVIGSKAELLERATAPAEELEELRRPWVDAIRIRCESCGGEVERIAEVGDVWLDAGIVPFSTLGWESPEYVREGYATGAARGLTSADLPDHAYWEEWFPADWVSEMREQIRLWFYSQLFMSVALTGRAPFRKVLGYEKMLDETGREMHGSWGNMIDAQDAFGRMGADVMRWQYCAQPPDRNLLFGFGPAREIQRRLLTLWNSVTFLVQYGNVESFTPRLADLEGVDAELEPSRPLAGRARTPPRRGSDRRVRAVAHRRRRPRVRGVRRRSLELVHPLLAAAVLERRRDRAPRPLARPRAVAPRRRADRPVSRRASVAGARPRAVRGRGRLRLPRRLARPARRPTPPCSRPWRTRGASSTSGALRGRPRGSSSGSRCRGSWSRARRRATASRRSSARSSASRLSSSAASSRSSSSSRTCPSSARGSARSSAPSVRLWRRGSSTTSAPAGSAPPARSSRPATSSSSARRGRAGRSPPRTG